MLPGTTLARQNRYGNMNTIASALTDNRMTQVGHAYPTQDRYDDPE
ncbi:hypothetical protein ENTCAN_06171 [Enterobacter cancerogenus ATCC 35316]|nr:hypothetical protein ENTCAN_06171 [Enterobacter cancerogenus ATCC 35316]